MINILLIALSVSIFHILPTIDSKLLVLDQSNLSKRSVKNATTKTVTFHSKRIEENISFHNYGQPHLPRNTADHLEYRELLTGTDNATVKIATKDKQRVKMQVRNAIESTQESPLKTAPRRTNISSESKTDKIHKQKKDKIKNKINGKAAANADRSVRTSSTGTDLNGGTIITASLSSPAHKPPRLKTKNNSNATLVLNKSSLDGGVIYMTPRMARGLTQSKMKYDDIFTRNSRINRLIRSGYPVLRPVGRSARRTVTVRPDIVPAFKSSSKTGTRTQVVNDVKTGQGPHPQPMHPKYESLRLNDGVDEFAKVEMESTDFYEHLFGKPRNNSKNQDAEEVDEKKKNNTTDESDRDSRYTRNIEDNHFPWLEKVSSEYSDLHANSRPYSHLTSNPTYKYITSGYLPSSSFRGHHFDQPSPSWRSNSNAQSDTRGYQHTINEEIRSDMTGISPSHREYLNSRSQPNLQPVYEPREPIDHAVSASTQDGSVLEYSEEPDDRGIAYSPPDHPYRSMKHSARSYSIGEIPVSYESPQRKYPSTRHRSTIPRDMLHRSGSLNHQSLSNSLPLRENFNSAYETHYNQQYDPRDTTDRYHRNEQVNRDHSTDSDLAHYSVGSSPILQHNNLPHLGSKYDEIKKSATQTYTNYYDDREKSQYDDYSGNPGNVYPSLGEVYNQMVSLREQAPQIPQRSQTLSLGRERNGLNRIGRYEIERIQPDKYSRVPRLDYSTHTDTPAREPEGTEEVLARDFSYPNTVHSDNRPYNNLDRHSAEKDRPNNRYYGRHFVNSPTELHDRQSLESLEQLYDNEALPYQRNHVKQDIKRYDDYFTGLPSGSRRETTFDRSHSFNDGDYRNNYAIQDQSDISSEILQDVRLHKPSVSQNSQSRPIGYIRLPSNPVKSRYPTRVLDYENKEIGEMGNHGRVAVHHRRQEGTLDRTVALPTAPRYRAVQRPAVLGTSYRGAKRRQVSNYL